LKIGVVGGMPSLLGGGGLEIQMAKTITALRALGHEVVDQDQSAAVDVLHIFGAEPSTWSYLRNWSRNRVPLVLSPVIVLDRPHVLLHPVIERLRLLASNTASMRVEVVQRADALVALNDAEARLLEKTLRCPPSSITVIGNGTDAASDVRAVEDRVVAVGTVGRRKRQRELASVGQVRRPDLVLVGPTDLSGRDQDEFERVVETRSNVTWVGRLPQQAVWDLQAGSLATVSASSAEGESLAFLDSLALGRPVVALRKSGLESLQAKLGADSAMVVESLEALGMRVDDLRAQAPPLATKRPPTWRQVAEHLSEVYGEVIGRHRRP